MWLYDKKLQFPLCIKKPDPRMAKLIITQYGGADDGLVASLRYLGQRFSMPTSETKATLFRLCPLQITLRDQIKEFSNHRLDRLHSECRTKTSSEVLFCYTDYYAFTNL